MSAPEGIAGTSMTPAVTNNQQAAFDLLSARTADLLAGNLYFPCVLLVHPTIAALHSAQQHLSSRQLWPTVSVGGFLSAAMSEAPFRFWQRTAQRSFHEEMLRQAPGPVICTDIDLLFEPSLGLDPLKLLRDASRQTAIVVMWPGQTKDTVLSYAVPEHAHYRTWRQTDLCDQCIIPL